MKTNREILAKFISTEGYKRNSPDKNRPFNIIPSGNITMQDVDFPVKGVDNLGNEIIMMPGEEYTFPGDYVVETPAMQAGGNVPIWLNPYNWGVTDYTNIGDFSSSYKLAKTRGETEFLWNGKRYSTQTVKEKERDGAYTPILSNEIDKFFTKSYEEYNVNRKDYKESQDYAELQAIKNYIGVKSDLSLSKYKPTISKNPNAIYYSYPEAYKDKILNAIERFESRPKSKVNPNPYTTALGNFNYGRGKDERGDYLGYADKWDLHPGQLMGVKPEYRSGILDTEVSDLLGVGKPFEIYDRIYIKDYGDGKQKRMYYSDKELSELDVNKKNFDTLALQRELSNRGFKLSNSTRKDGTFDGVLGEETKKALLDWKQKQTPKKEEGGQTGWLDNYQDGGPQMYPAPSLEFQKRVQDNIRRNQVQPTFVRREPVTVSQSDNTRTNAVENAKRDLESYTPQERAYFAQNNIPRDQWFSAKTKMQNDAVLKKREEIKRQAQADVRNNPFAITPATNEQLRNEFRAFPNDPNSFFDEYLNPAQMIGNMAASIGENFTGEGPVDPWKLATDIVTPAFVGMTAGIGAQNTGQFANNLINPLAGMRNPLSRVSSKIEPIDNVLDKGVLEEIRYAFHNNQRRLSADERKILYQYGTGQPSDYFDENLQSLSSQFMQERASPRYKPHLLADDWHKMANGLRPINYPHLTRESNEVKQHLLNSRRNTLPPPPSEIQFMPDGTTRDIYTQQPQPIMPTMLGGIDIRRPINGHAPGTDEWNRLNNLLHSRARNNYKPKSVNKSGLTKEETLQKVTGKDKDAISKMSETEFENTVLKPDGQLAEYKADPFVEQMMFDRSTGRNVLKDQTVLTEQQYIDTFNSNLDLLNDIIKRRNKSGVDYKVKGLNPNGSLTFYTPEQTIANANNPVPKHYLDALNKIDEPDFLYKKTSDDKFYFSNMSGSPGFTSKEEAKKWISDLIDEHKGIKINSGESNWGVRLNPGKWKGDVEDLANTEYFRSIPGIEMSNTTAGVFSDKVARKGTGAYESINEYLKALDLGRVKPGFNSQTDYSRGAWENFIKSGRGVGFYANPRTVYGTMKTLAPIGVGIGAGAAINTKEKGGETGWLDKYK